MRKFRLAIKGWFLSSGGKRFWVGLKWRQEPSKLEHSLSVKRALCPAYWWLEGTEGGSRMSGCSLQNFSCDNPSHYQWIPHNPQVFSSVSSSWIGLHVPSEHDFWTGALCSSLGHRPRADTFALSPTKGQVQCCCLDKALHPPLPPHRALLLYNLNAASLPIDNQWPKTHMGTLCNMISLSYLT